MSSALSPGTLRSAVEQTTQRALRLGALLPIRTVQVRVEEADVRFLVRSVSSLVRKQADRRLRAAAGEKGAQRGNPFLPPEPELTVCDLGEAHLAVLNKFHVLDRHLLVVTRRFEHQESLLTEADFHALWLCMDEYEALGFYNGGALAGASQPHKHLQVVPLPLVPGESEVPIAPLLAALAPGAGVQRIPAFAFSHGLARLDVLRASPREAARRTLEVYRRLLQAVGIGQVLVEGEPRQSAPYNLLMTRRWMLLIARSAECWHGISVNSLGFAGSLFVRDRAQMDLIRARGPLAVLAGVARPWEGPPA